VLAEVWQGDMSKKDETFYYDVDDFKRDIPDLEEYELDDLAFYYPSYGKTWRPFIVDLSDTRLVRWQPREYGFEIDKEKNPAKVEVEVRYHLLHEKRRARINYRNEEPINYPIYSKTIEL